MADGKKIKLAAERFEAAEILFRPELINKEQKGISELVFQVIQDADIDLRACLYEHIIVSGGTSVMPGFVERLQTDLERMYAELIGVARAPSCKKVVNIRVIAPAEQKHAVYTGGAVLAEIMKDNEIFWVTRNDWNTLGPAKSLQKLFKNFN